MDPKFLQKMMEKRLMAQQEHPHGIPISSLSGIVVNNECDSRALVIPSGIGSVNLNHFKEMRGVTIAEGIDRNYVSNNTSFAKFVGTVDTLKPTMIVAGSRGAELVARFLEKVKYNGIIVLLGAVHLSRVFEANKTNRLLIVHGSQDKNEKIEGVRGMVANNNKATLVEATNKGHDLNFENKSVLVNVIRYAYSLR